MFNEAKFNAMISSRGFKKKDVAEYLGIKYNSLYKKCKDNGNFTANEIRMLITAFSREEVLDCLFYYD